MAFSSEQEQRNLVARHRRSRLFATLCAVVTWSSVFLLGVLLVRVSLDGLGWLDWQFIDSFPSRIPERAGIKAALVGTLWMIILVALIAIPVGVSAALYLEEFAKRGRLSRLIEVNIANLAGVPSIV
ncbi:MAG: phosphate ABC transporter, permease protein PstA, partial [Pseudohongiellaceae bacterium]